MRCRDNGLRCWKRTLKRFVYATVSLSVVTIEKPPRLMGRWSRDEERLKPSCNRRVLEQADAATQFHDPTRTHPSSKLAINSRWRVRAVLDAAGLSARSGNHALEYAVQQANLLEQPMLVVFGLMGANPASPVPFCCCSIQTTYVSIFVLLDRPTNAPHRIGIYLDETEHVAEECVDVPRI